MTHGRGLAGGFVVLAAFMAVQSSAHAAEVVSRERGGIPGEVAVHQGRTTFFTIEVSSFGNVICTTERTSGIGTRVHTRYRIGAGGASSGGDSRFLPLYSNDVLTQLVPPACGVRWDGAPRPYRVSARVDAASDASPGVHTVPLRAVIDPNSAVLGPIKDDQPDRIRVRVIRRYSSPGNILVVSANLKAANLTDRGPLSRRTGKMALFVDRVLNDLRAHGQPLPDVLTLQEVVHRFGRRGPVSAPFVASYLSSRTGDPYAVVVKPGTKASLVKPRTYRETAIIANLRTMRGPIASGFVETPCRAWSGICRQRAPTWSQAWAVLPETSSRGRTFPVASVHVLPRLNSLFFCRRGGCLHSVAHLRRRWVEAVIQRLRGASGGNFARAVIAGDFNATSSQGFYRALRDNGFVNTLPGLRLPTDPFRVVDFIFTRGRVLRAGLDRRRKGRSRGHPYGYSDHRFLWAAIGG